MDRLIISQYLLKCFGFVLLFGFISLGAIGGCNNNGGQDGTRALTENDFSENPSLSARPDGGVVVHFLEPPSGEKPVVDTGEVGMDVIPYRYNQAFEHTICWEDDDQGAGHFMTLMDSDGEEVLMLEVNGDCVTEVIEKGNYEMHVHHDGMSEDTHPIFIQPQIEDQLAGNTASEQGLIKTVKRIFEETLSNIGISTEARAQDLEMLNIISILATGECQGCDLKNAVLSTLDSPASLFGALLNNANLSGAKLLSAHLNGANLNGANLTGADLSFSDLLDANLRNANLTNANLFFVNLMGARFNGATWCNGCTCTSDNCPGCQMQASCMDEP